MTLKELKEHRLFRPVAGAVLCVFCGLGLLFLTLGEPWVQGSYDNLYRFGTHGVKNPVVLVLMDNDAYEKLNQARGPGHFWDRNLHASLLSKLADDACPLVVMDVRLLKPGDAEKDRSLASAMSRLTNIVLAAELTLDANSRSETHQIQPPCEPFLTAAKGNWGVTWHPWDADYIVRKHFPFPSPEDGRPALTWVAAKLRGARLDEKPVGRWFRYYDFDKAWSTLSYHIALAQGAGYFSNKVVFIGNDPQNTVLDGEPDKFRAPNFINSPKETLGGVKLLATEYLNLMNGDWLRRAPWLVETLLLALMGALAGYGLCSVRRLAAIALAVGGALAVTIGAVLVTNYTNYWFPWLVFVGGQLPCALAWAMIPRRQPVLVVDATQVVPRLPEPQNATMVLTFPEDSLPNAPEYELLQPPIGKGGFGRVWLARNAIGQWQALKAVYESNFQGNRAPYEAEFKGLQRYKPISEKHPGLLRIDLVSRMKDEGYFYYVMELGDAQTPGWESDPKLYKPRDLENLRKAAPNRRLPVPDCLRIVTVLADALNFLHQQGLTHRDIKPSNVIFVNGRPKLADVGLVADIRPVDQVHTLVGTPGYMPPPPEKPGTPQADIYALGMVLYVISSGREPGHFPDIATTLMDSPGHAEFARLNAIVLKACQPDLTLRYQTTAEMLQALQKETERG